LTAHHPPNRGSSHRLLSFLLRLAMRVQAAAQGRLFARALRQAPGTVFTPRPDDVYVVSYPKSGTTLLQMMLHQLTTDGAPGSPEVGFRHVETVSPWYELTVHGGHAHLLEALPSPRVFKSHALYEWLPRTGRFVYVARDLRDVAVSGYHQYRRATGLDVDLRHYLDIFLTERLPILGDSWFRHIESWWPHRDDGDVLFLTFEEVTRDLEGTARRVAEHCGLEVDGATLARTVERCGLDFMRRHDAKFDSRRRRVAATPEAPVLDAALDPDSPGLLGGEALAGEHEERLAEKLRALAGEVESAGGELLDRFGGSRRREDG